VNSRLQTSRSFGLILVAVAWAAFLVLIDSPAVILFTAPLFLLAAPLALGRYVGESVVDRLARAWSKKKPRAARAIGRRRVAVLVLGRGGKILAAGLAGRGPPLQTL
jgi:hypothetical protein